MRGVLVLMIKLNRKPNGDVLGLPVFFGQEIIGKFVNEKTSYVEIKKTILENGVLLEFEPIKTEVARG